MQIQTLITSYQEICFNLMNFWWKVHVWVYHVAVCEKFHKIRSLIKKWNDSSKIFFGFSLKSMEIFFTFIIFAFKKFFIVLYFIVFILLSPPRTSCFLLLFINLLLFYSLFIYSLIVISLSVTCKALWTTLICLKAAIQVFLMTWLICTVALEDVPFLVALSL